jgi:hypothetical protein
MGIVKKAGDSVGISNKSGIKADTPMCSGRVPQKFKPIVSEQCRVQIPTLCLIINYENKEYYYLEK